MWLVIASSISSPPTRSDCETTMPPRLITATSVVPPPMSTIMFPVGSATGRPAPIAAAIGSSIRYAWRAPALSVASSTARFSTPVTPDGTQTTTRGCAKRCWCTFWMKWRSICSVTSKSAITPSFSGRIALIVPGGAAEHALGLEPDGVHLARALVDRDDRRLAEHDAAAAHVDERVGGAEIDRHVASAEAGEVVEDAHVLPRECRCLARRLVLAEAVGARKTSGQQANEERGGQPDDVQIVAVDPFDEARSQTLNGVGACAALPLAGSEIALDVGGGSAGET